MTEVDMCLRVLAAAGMGFVVGLEREAMNKPAGLRTHLIVSAAAALLTTTSILVGEKLGVPGEALRVAAGVVTGIGFIGAGTILQTKHRVMGLTTAATVFMAAAIGIATGTGLYQLALCATALTIFSNWLLLPLQKMFGRNDQDPLPAEAPRRQKIGRPTSMRER